MSTLKTDGGGLVIISQARAQNDPVNAPEEQSHYSPSSMPKPLAAFYSGEPEVLGTVQIFVGILFITFGITLTISVGSMFDYFKIVLDTGVLLWSGLLYIVSGSLSLAASVKPTIGKVKSSLVMNIFSTAGACIAILLIITVFPSPVYLHYSNLFCAYYKPNTECTGAFNPKDCLGGIMVFLFLLTVLMFCITISTSVFGCKTACRSSYHEMTVVIYQSTYLNAPVTTTDAPPASTIALDS
ncbi:membrane-spanning 4-domains subfamily A member 4A-like [Rhinoderma darwinii]|uniref:membrane-spanning 4-domains subfamily A member 4A-like n=1 Tax=Rhinoderma darwinii TaxID=43563 RepID=UPI003F67DE79